MDSAEDRLRAALLNADAVFIGAGSGLSTAAGYVYTGERFKKYFGDFAEKYSIPDMYSGGFFEFPTEEEFWAYWSRYIWINRYTPVPGTIYADILKTVKSKDYFVLTTNVDHCFQKTGFAKERLFYTQGDYGLFQCKEPCCRETWDNYDTVKRMVLSQGYTIAPDGALLTPEDGAPLMKIPSELIPVCPHCGGRVSLNLRADDTFVEDMGWHRAAERYQEYVDAHRGARILYLEIGVGYNTPGIVKYNFWQQTYKNPNAIYACLNYSEPCAPKEIAERSILFKGDCRALVKSLAAAQANT